MTEKEVIVSGPIIIDNGKLLVDKDEKDDFYKVPGGRLKENETLEECCIREAWEEVNAEVIIIKKLSTLILDRNPTTNEKMRLEVHSFLCDVKNISEIEPVHPIKEIKWLEISKIKSGKYNVAPSIKFLVEKGEIK